MSEKSILFMARTTRFHDFVRTLTSSIAAEVYVATPDSPSVSHEFNLLILDADGVRPDRIDAIAKWLDSRGSAPMLLLVDEENLSNLHLPAPTPISSARVRARWNSRRACVTCTAIRTRTLSTRCSRWTTL